jgi:hypothetical protein
MITLAEAQDELDRIEAIGERGLCRRKVCWVDTTARDLVPDYFLAHRLVRVKRRFEAAKAALRSHRDELQRPVRERQERKRARSAAMLAARIRKARPNDPDFLAILARAEVIAAVAGPAL